MWDTGDFDPLIHDDFEWDPAVEDGPHERVQRLYPSPQQRGQLLQFSELLNGSAAFVRSSAQTMLRYDSEALLNPLSPAFDQDEIRQYAGVFSPDRAWADEISHQPHMAPYPTGCKKVCDSAPHGPFVEVEIEHSFQVVDQDVGYALFQDESSAGLLFWYGGGYHFFDFSTEAFAPAFSSTVVLSECRQFGTLCLGSDLEGNVYRVELAGITPIGAKGKPFGLLNKYIIVDDGQVCSVFDLSGAQLASGASAFPWYSARSFTQNHLAAGLGKKWATVAGDVASFSGGAVSQSEGDGRFIHGTAGKKIQRDWIRKKGCPSEKSHSYLTPRHPCTDIVVDPSSRELMHTTTWGSYKNSNAEAHVPMWQLHRLDRVSMIGHHEVRAENEFDTIARTNTATVYISARLVSY